MAHLVLLREGGNTTLRHHNRYCADERRISSGPGRFYAAALRAHYALTVLCALNRSLGTYGPLDSALIAGDSDGLDPYGSAGGKRRWSARKGGVGDVLRPIVDI